MRIIPSRTTTFIQSWQVLYKTFNNYYLLLFCAALVGLSACENPRDLGLNLPDGFKKAELIYVDTLPIKMTTVLLDTFPTFAPTRLVVGDYNDNLFGRITARSYGSLAPIADTVFIETPSQVIADSLVLEMELSSAYGDTTATQTLSLHRLTSAIPAKNYYNFDQVPFDPTPIAQSTFSVQSVGSGKKLRIKLPNTLRDEVLNTIKTSKDSANFIQTFRGFALQSTNNAAVVAFSASPISSKLLFYYRNSTDASNAVKQTEFYFRLYNTFNQIIHNPIGTNLSTISSTNRILTATQTLDRGYLFNLLGIVIKIELPDFKTLADPAKGEVLAINRADLVFYADEQSYTKNDLFPIPTLLALYQSDANNRIKRDGLGFFQGIQAEGANPFNNNNTAEVTYNNFGFFYRFPITTYLQLVQRGDIQNNGIIISERFYEIDGTQILVTFSSFRRLLIDNRRSSSRKIRLELFYTKFK
ncbi:MAG: DUF4270 family protein [Cytophagales bacterium]|nr:MAG: DUF4270 family protein [Cytophagales bacterium]